jgi:hypothetical protein
MATALEIVRTISSIVNEMGHDGALTKDGEPVKIGLKREEGHPILDKRVIDGFGVRFHGDQLIINYQSEILLSEIYKGDLEGDVDQTIQDVAKWIKKEYKKVTGSPLTLKPASEVYVCAENTSRVRYFVTAHRTYDIGGMKGTDPVKGESKDSIEASFKAFLESPKAKRPSNDTRRG